MAYFQDTPNKTLFLYTSKAVFRGIVGRRNLWFSNLPTGNNPRDFSLAIHSLPTVMKEPRAGATESERQFLTKIESNLRSHRGSSQVFCCCFSLARDELPMWNQYGSAHTGVCIGFRPTAFRATAGRMQQAKYVDPSTHDDL